jgi:hypothetical protein
MPLWIDVRKSAPAEVAEAPLSSAEFEGLAEIRYVGWDPEAFRRELSDRVGGNRFPMSDEDMSGWRSAIADPLEQRPLVRMGREDVELSDFGVRGNPISVNLDRFHAARDCITARPRSLESRQKNRIAAIRRDSLQVVRGGLKIGSGPSRLSQAG